MNELLDEEELKLLEGENSPREVADFSLDLPRNGSQFTSPINGRKDTNVPHLPLAERTQSLCKQQLMEQFNEQLVELEMRLNKGMQIGKDLKLETKLRGSTNSMAGLVRAETTGDILDLKAELVNMKNKVFTQEQEKQREIQNQKNQVVKLEQ